MSWLGKCWASLCGWDLQVLRVIAGGGEGGENFSSWFLSWGVLNSLYIHQRVNSSLLAPQFLGFVLPVNFIFAVTAVLLEWVHAHRAICRQWGKLLGWLRGVSSLAANLCGLGKGSSITVASAENRPGSVLDGQHDLYDRRTRELGGEGRSRCGMMHAVELLNLGDKA